MREEEEKVIGGGGGGEFVENEMVVGIGCG